MEVVKRNKRLFIENNLGEVIYTPPYFVHIQSRDQLRTLAQAIAAQGYIDAVMEFESKYTRR